MPRWIRLPRISLRVPRTSSIAVTWSATLVLAGGIGWAVARLGVTGGLPRDVSERTESVPVQFAPALEPRTEPVADVSPAALAQAPDVAPRETAPSPPERPAAAALLPPADIGPVPTSDELEVAAEPSPPGPDGSRALERAAAAARLAEAGQVEQAKREAEALLEEYVSYTGFETALVASGADAVHAQLTALRMIQVAGMDETSREVARELKRSYSGSREVLDAIHEWRILKPRITSIETSIEEGRRVVVSGTLENPDIVDVRRVHVRVEALDAAGNLLSEIETRVSPKLLKPGSRGEFTVSFGKLDPATVLRARASVLAWDSEVLAAS